MEGYVMEVVSAILLAVFGGANIWQFIYYKTQRDKLRAEADKLKAMADEEKVNAKHKGLDLMQDQADYLLEKLNTVQADYVALQSQMRTEMANHTMTINTKCNEIAELKSKVIYLKGIRCYKSDCSLRISVNPKDSSDIKEG